LLVDIYPSLSGLGPFLSDVRTKTLPNGHPFLKNAAKVVFLCQIVSVKAGYLGYARSVDGMSASCRQEVCNVFP
jgi:hypothetical protein